jgi:hypothetical protein
VTIRRAVPCAVVAITIKCLTDSVRIANTRCTEVARQAVEGAKERIPFRRKRAHAVTREAYSANNLSPPVVNE